MSIDDDPLYRLAVEPFNPVQAEVDYNLMVLRRTRIVAWDCSTVALLKIRARLTRQDQMVSQYPLRRIDVPVAA